MRCTPTRLVHGDFESDNFNLLALGSRRVLLTDVASPYRWECRDAKHPHHGVGARPLTWQGVAVLAFEALVPAV